MLELKEKNIEGYPHVILIYLKGALDSESAYDFEEAINYLIKKNKNIIFDFLELEYISSAGIGALISIFNTAKTYGKIIAIYNMNKEIKMVLEFLKLDKEFYNALNQEDALLYILREVGEKEEKSSASIKQNVKHYSIEQQEENTQIEESFFEPPIIVECKYCGKKSKVRKTGVYKCPFCNASFTVFSKDKIIFS